MKISAFLSVSGLALVALLGGTAVAQQGGYYNGYQGNNWQNGSYGGRRLNAHDQSVYDQLYNNYLQAQQINNQGQVRKAESAMQKVYSQYGIPSNTPYSAVASSGYGNNGYGNNGYGRDRDHDHDHDRDRGYNNGYNNGNNGYNTGRRLDSHDQNVYDQLYANWLQARSINASSQMQKAESAMQNVYRKYGIPSGTPYSAVASQGR